MAFKFKNLKTQTQQLVLRAKKPIKKGKKAIHPRFLCETQRFHKFCKNHKKLVQRTVVAFVILAVVLFIAVALLFWRLSQAPLSVNFMKPQIQQALVFDAAPQAEIKDIFLTWAGIGKPIDLHLKDLRLKDANGDFIAHFPDILVGFNFADFVFLRFKPSRARLESPTIALVRQKDGHFAFSFKKPVEEDTLEAPLEKEKKTPFHDDSFLKNFRVIQIKKADLIVHDQISEKTWNMKNVSLSYTRHGRSKRTSIVTKIPLEYGSLILDVDLGKHKNHAEVMLNNLHPQQFALFANYLPEKTRVALESIDMPLSGALSLDFLTRDELVAPKLDALRFDLFGGPGVLRFSSLGKQDYILTFFEASGSASLRNEPEITINNLAFDFGALKTKLKGSVKKGHLNIEGNFADFAMKELPKFWPAGLADGARGWIFKNLKGGMFTSGNVVLDANVDFGVFPPSLEVTSVGGNLEIEKTSIHYLGDLPLIKDVNASARYDLQKFDIEILSGKTRDLKITGGTVLLDQLDQDIPVADIDLAIKGPLTQALWLINHAPLNYIDKLGKKPEMAKGNADIALGLGFPLSKDLMFNQVDVDVTGLVDQAYAQDVYRDFDLAEGRLNLELNQDAMTISGDAKLDGTSVELVWHEKFKPEKIKRAFDIKGHFLAEKIHEYGYFPFKNMLFGTIYNDLNITQYADNTVRVDMKNDLKNTGIRILGYKKQQGVEGHMTGRVFVKNKQLHRIDDIRVESSDLNIMADLKRGKKGHLLVDIHHTEMGKSSFAGKSTIYPKTKRTVTELKGASFDADFLLRPKNPKMKAKGDLQFKGQFGKVYLGNFDAPIRDVEVEFTRVLDKTHRLAIKGKTADGGRIDASIFPEIGGKKGPRRRFYVYSNDAGSILKSSNHYKNMKEGTLTVTGFYNDAKPISPFKGKMIIKNFRLVKAPLLLSLVSSASFTGMADNLNARGLTFDKLEAEIEKVGSKVTINDARTSGSAIGFTAKGTANTKLKTINVTGLMIPAHTFNKALASIPVVGTILTGIDGEGLFAVDYAIEGKLNAPTVVVNPLSSIAPGMLRDLVKAFDSD
ncbi:MAG: YhdP family protein [Alphaproteobacteria bacterium]